MRWSHWSGVLAALSVAGLGCSADGSVDHGPAATKSCASALKVTIRGEAARGTWSTIETTTPPALVSPPKEVAWRGDALPRKTTARLRLSQADGHSVTCMYEASERAFALSGCDAPGDVQGVVQAELALSSSVDGEASACLDGAAAADEPPSGLGAPSLPPEAIATPGGGGAVQDPIPPAPTGRTLPGVVHTAEARVGVAEAERIHARSPHLEAELAHLTENLAQAKAASTLPEVVDQAAALGKDVDRIFEYVYDEIAYLGTWGLKKGPVAVMQDRAGNAFDQANLMVQLLRASGYTADFVMGKVRLSGDDAEAWFGTRKFDVLKALLPSGGIPCDPFTIDADRNVTTVPMAHVWVRVTGKELGATVYHFDPARKKTTGVTGSLDLKGAMAYDRAAFVGALGGAAGDLPGSLKGFSGTALRNQLHQYTTKVVGEILARHRAETLDQVFGGRSTVRVAGGPDLRQTDNPVRDAAAAPTVWAGEVPDSYRATMRLRLGGFDYTQFADNLSGKRLTVRYGADNRAVLSLDGVQQAKATAAGTAGKTQPMQVDLHEVAASGGLDQSQSISLTVRSGHTFAVMNGWGTVGRGMVELHRKRARELRAAGAAADSEGVVGESLQAMADLWLAERSAQAALADRVTPTTTVTHHMVGVAGQTTAPYVDIPLAMVSSVSKTDGRDLTGFYNNGGFGSAFESTVIEQTQAVQGISTVSLFDVANGLGNTFYEATSANWATVRPKLAAHGFTAAELSWADSYVNGGWRLIVPGNGDLGKGTWKGFTFLGVTPDESSITYIINGAKGGYSSNNVATDTVTTAINASSASSWIDGGQSSVGVKSGDPVAVASGDFTHAVEDLSVGPAGARLVFSRGYNSGASAHAARFGLGWGHNFGTAVTVDSDGFQGMGEDSSADAAAMAVALYVSYDLLSVDKSLKSLVLSSLVQQWGTKNLVDNAATVSTPAIGGRAQFIQAPNGFNGAAALFRWLPPPASASTLDKPTNFRLTSKTQAVTDFNAKGAIASTRDPNGQGLTFAYSSGGALTSVTHTFGWKLSFAYDTKGRLHTVKNGAGTVTYGYDAAGNLATVTNPLGKVTKYTYVAPGRMGSMFYPADPTIPFVTNVYDSYGRVTKQRNAAGALTQYLVSGYRSEEIDPAGGSKVWFFDHDSGRPMLAFDAVGRPTVSTYDGQGNLVLVKNPEGDRVAYRYDDRYNLIETRRQAKDASSDLVTTTAYHATWNKPTRVRDPLLNETSFDYDAKGNLSRRTDPVVDGVTPVTTYTYNARGQLDTETDATSRVTKYAYDEAGKKALLTVTKDPAGLKLVTTYGYDAVGNVTSVKDPRGSTTTHLFSLSRKHTQETRAVPETGLAAPVTKWTYDADDRLDEVQQLLGTTTFHQKTTYAPTWKVASVSAWAPAIDATTPKTVTSYDAADRVSTVTDREGRVTKFDYFPDGQPKSETRAFGTSDAATYAAYTYTPNGKPMTVTDANGNRTTYEYDVYDRPIKTFFPNKSLAGISDTADYEHLGYDAAGNVRSRRTRAGQTLTFGYDALNRRRSQSGGGAQDVLYDLDPAGRTRAVRFADGSHTIVYSFDAAGRSTDVADTVGTWTRVMKRTLDANGNLARIDWPDGYFVTYEYDADSRLRTIKESGTTVVASFSYDQMSRRSKLVRGGLTTTYSYSASGPATGRLYQITHDAAGAADDVTLTYGYNGEGQVAGVWASNPAYVYVPGADATVASVPNGQNELASVASVPQTYDGNGNAVDPDGFTLTHDGLNRLVAAQKTGLSAAYGYDPAGRRAKKTVNGTTTQTLYLGLAELGDYSGTNTLVRRYIPGARLDEVVAIVEGGARRYPMHDRLGSVIGTADGAGNVVAKYTYDPFGQAGSATCQESAANCDKHRFAGRALDAETGLYDLRARSYSPKLGRFLQPDPLHYKDDVNLYAYAHGDPATLVDPLGTEAQTPSGGGTSHSFWDYVLDTRLVGASLGMGYAYPTATPGPDVGYNASVNVGMSGLSVEAIATIDTNETSVYRTEYRTTSGIDVGFSPAMGNIVFSFDPHGSAQDVMLGRSDYVTGFGFTVFWNDSGFGVGTAAAGAGVSVSRGVSYSTLCTSATQCGSAPANWDDHANWNGAFPPWGWP